MTYVDFLASRIVDLAEHLAFEFANVVKLLSLLHELIIIMEVFFVFLVEMLPVSWRMGWGGSSRLCYEIENVIALLF